MIEDAQNDNWTSVIPLCIDALQLEKKSCVQPIASLGDGRTDGEIQSMHSRTHIVTSDTEGKCPKNKC